MSQLTLFDLKADRINEVWGWTDPQSGEEYALVCHLAGTAFIEVTDPENPVYLGNLPIPDGAQPNFWHDLKTYDNHLFVVADGAGQHGMQVFDLTELRSVDALPVTFSMSAHYTEFASAHNLAINEASGYAYVMGANLGGNTCGGGLHMVDISAPQNPVSAGCFNDGDTGSTSVGYVHDAHCVIYEGPDAAYQGREICVTSNETALTIVDVTDKENPVRLSKASYPNVTYAHQGWFTEDHRYFLMGDELDESNGNVTNTRTIFWDLLELDDPQVLTIYEAATASSDHNLYVAGDYAYLSNYTSGLRILDVSDPANPIETAFFDTVPGADNPVFQGAWGSYPYFESGNIVVSSSVEGLFVLRPSELPVSNEEISPQPAAFALSGAFPNPFHASTEIKLYSTRTYTFDLAVYDALGRRTAVIFKGTLAQGTHRFTFKPDHLPSGKYFIRIESQGQTISRMISYIK